MKYLLITLQILLFTTGILNAFGSAGIYAQYESRRIVTYPSAGLLPKNSYGVNSLFFESGGAVVAFSYAPLNRLNLGMSFGGSNLIGEETPLFQNFPGLQISFRPINETLYFPAISLGLDTQGYGTYNNKLKRYQHLSPGAYLVLSKSFNWSAGYLGLHFGTNYTFERSNENLNYYIGLEQSIGKRSSINIENIFYINDKDAIYMDKSSLLNAAFRFSITTGTTIEIQFKDLLQNDKNYNKINRNILLEFIF